MGSGQAFRATQSGSRQGRRSCTIYHGLELDAITANSSGLDCEENRDQKNNPPIGGLLSFACLIVTRDDALISVIEVIRYATSGQMGR